MTEPIITGLDTWWIIPGVVLGGEYPCDAKGSGDKLESLLEFGVDTIVNLTHKDDNLTPYYFSNRGLKGYALWVSPIPDGGVVALDSYKQIVEEIKRQAEQGHVIYVHCWGGMGRTATVAGCLLAATTTHSPDDIFAQIDESRRKTSVKADRPAPENDQQRQIVRDFYHTYGTWGSDA